MDSKELLFLCSLKLLLEDQTISDTGWSSCPMDILFLIFEYLDGESLFNCLRINCWWRDVVDYYIPHYSKWRDIAEVGILNRGTKLRSKSFPETGWRDLFFNYHLWHFVDSANISWKFFTTEKKMQTLHVFKDSLLYGYGEKDNNLGGDVYKELQMVGMKIEDVLPSQFVPREKHITPKPKCKRLKSEENSLSENTQNDEETVNRMKEKLFQVSPFTKYSVFDDNCFYILDAINVLRRFVWDDVEKEWQDQVLGRYYGCSRSIKDIHIAENDVHILLNNGNVMRADRKGRNFENSAHLDLPPQSSLLFMRLLRSPVLRRLETAYKLKMSPFTAGPKVLFHKFSAVVGVPLGYKFNIRRQTDVDQVVLECPHLSSAMEHGEMLILGYYDGRVDICKVKDLFEIGYKPKLTFNILDCPNIPEKIHDPAIVGIEVFETKESHHLFVATRLNLFTITLTYPETVLNSVSAIKRIST